MMKLSSNDEIFIFISKVTVLVCIEAMAELKGKFCKRVRADDKGIYVLYGNDDGALKTATKAFDFMKVPRKHNNMIFPKEVVPFGLWFSMTLHKGQYAVISHSLDYWQVDQNAKAKHMLNLEAEYETHNRKSEAWTRQPTPASELRMVFELAAAWEVLREI